VSEDAVGNTSVLDVTPPEAGTLIAPLVYDNRNANGVEEYWAVRARTDATYVVFAAMRTGVVRFTVRQPAVADVGDPLPVASFVPVDDQSVTVYVLVQFAGR
jgi:hypothetical protein